jgi:hypothetical protein
MYLAAVRIFRWGPSRSILRRCRPKLFLEVDDRWVRSFGFYGVDSAVNCLTEEQGWTGGVLCSWEELRGVA